MSGQLTKILYLEDDPSIYDLVLMSLGDDPELEVKHFWSGEYAIRAFESFMPDLLLLDVMLPDFDGLETLAHIRRLPGGNDVPVIFMTARAQPREQETYFRLGAIGVIVKPFDAHTLGDQIKALMRAQGSGISQPAARVAQARR